MIGMKLISKYLVSIIAWLSLLIKVLKKTKKYILRQKKLNRKFSICFLNYKNISKSLKATVLRAFR